MSYLDRLKRLDAGEKSQHTPQPEPTKPSKGASVGFVGSIPGANENIFRAKRDADTAACWCWWLAFSETEHKIVYFHPDATQAEVLQRYSGVLVAEPYDPTKASAETDSECIEMCEF